MNPDMIFRLVGPLAMTGWLALVFAPLAPRAAQGWVFGVIGVQSVLHAGLVLAFWVGAPGGFDTLAAVQALFGTPEIALAGWVHYLGFDLFVGAWAVRTAQAEGIGHLRVVPCLVLTFLFGPAGLLAFAALRFALVRKVLP